MFKTLKDILKNIRGVNMTETMVGGGIIAALLLGAGKVTNDYAKANRDVETDQLLNFWTERARITLRSKTNCEALVGNGVIATPAGAGPSGDIQSFDAAAVIDANNGNAQVFDPAYFQAANTSSDAMTSRALRGINLPAGAGVTLTSYIRARREARIRINFQKVRANNPAPITFFRSFSIRVRDNGAGNLECWDQDENFQDAFEDLMCNSLHDNGHPNAAMAPLAAAPNNLREKCELAATEAVARVKRAICEDSMGTNSTECMTLYQAGFAPCPAGQYVVGFNANPSGNNPASGSLVCSGIRSL